MKTTSKSSAVLLFFVIFFVAFVMAQAQEKMILPMKVGKSIQSVDQQVMIKLWHWIVPGQVYIPVGMTSSDDHFRGDYPLGRQRRDDVAKIIDSLGGVIDTTSTLTVVAAPGLRRGVEVFHKKRQLAIDSLRQLVVQPLPDTLGFVVMPHELYATVGDTIDKKWLQARLQGWLRTSDGEIQIHLHPVNFICRDTVATILGSIPRVVEYRGFVDTVLIKVQYQNKTVVRTGVLAVGGDELFALTVPTVGLIHERERRLYFLDVGYNFFTYQHPEFPNPARDWSVEAGVIWRMTGFDIKTGLLIWQNLNQTQHAYYSAVLGQLGVVEDIGFGGTIELGLAVGQVNHYQSGPGWAVMLTAAVKLNLKKI